MATEMLNQIYKLPVNEREELKEKLLKEAESSGQTKPQISEKEFLRQLFDKGFIRISPKK